MCEAKSKILIAESDKEEASELAKHASGSGFSVRLAKNGEEALAFASVWAPEILVVGRELPDMSGSQLALLVREGLNSPDLPVIMSSKEYDTKSGPVHDTDDFIGKPVNPEEMLFRIRKILNLRKKEKRLEDLNVRLQKEKETLSRYFSLDFVEKVLADEVAPGPGGSNVTASIMFFDMRGSTGLSEILEPGQFAEVFNQLFTDLMDLVYGHRGSVNKLLGDGMLATFGCPEPSPDDAKNCATCAIQIREYMKTFNEFRWTQG